MFLIQTVELVYMRLQISSPAIREKLGAGGKLYDASFPDTLYVDVCSGRSLPCVRRSDGP